MNRCLVLFVAIVLLAEVAWGAPGAYRYLSQPDGWFAGDEAAQAAANILSYQAELGGWPKNVDTSDTRFSGDPKTLKATFDNSATTDELRFLARIYDATHEPRYRAAFEKGMDYILKGQYAHGGWPQYWPSEIFHRHITFNDDAMVRLMEFLRETYSDPHYAFVDEGRREAARAAFDRGVQCILKCQVRVDGQLTAWCAQHDETDFSPRPARTFELTSLSGMESVGIVRLLMSLDHPSPEVVHSVEAAVAWFQAVKLEGIKVVTVDDPNSPSGKDKRVLQDPSAPPLWARFYEIGTNRPIFSDRDSVPRRELKDLGYERRNGYSWLGDWPQQLLERDYPAWKQKN